MLPSCPEGAVDWFLVNLGSFVGWSEYYRNAHHGAIALNCPEKRFPPRLMEAVCIDVVIPED